MSNQAITAELGAAAFNMRLGVLLAAAMFVLVVDTSLMNVSISAVVTDIGATASGVQAAIALEALVSAAFILISSKVGDLIGRKKAYVLGLLGYAIGALAMVLTQSLLPMIVFWAIFGGLGASLLLPAMQSLIHGNFEGAAQKRVYALVGASAAIAAAVGPLIGGFVTTFLSWRVGFLLELVVIGVVLAGIGLVRDVPFTGDRRVDFVGAVLSVLGMGGIVLSILVWQEGGEAVLALLVVGAVSLRIAVVLAGPPQEGRQRDVARSRPAALGHLSIGHQQPDAPTDCPWRRDDRPAAVPADGPRVQRPAGRPVARAAIADDVLRRHPRRAPSRPSSAGCHHPHRFRPARDRHGPAAADRSPRRLGPVARARTGDRRRRPGRARVAAQQLHLAPISGERISEAAGVNSAAGSFGLSFGLAFGGGVMLAVLALTFTTLADQSVVLSPDQKTQIAAGLEENAQLLSNTTLDEMITQQPPEVEAEIIRINTEARPIALQAALLVPLLAGLIGFLLSFRMLKQPDVEPSADLESVALGG